MGGHSSSAEMPGEIISVKACDGFPLVIERLGTRDGLTPKGPPVVLCPGFGGNRFNFNFDEKHSLALYLAAEGFDVWIVELRGHGRSKLITHPRTRGRARPWNMDDHIEKDVPAIIDTVIRLSAQSKLVWVGHSLGGMVAYCLLSRVLDQSRYFAGLITLGSPGRVERKSRIMPTVATPLLRVLKRRATLPTRSVMRALFSPAARRLGLRRFWRYWLNPDNLDWDVLQETMRIGAEDFSPGTLHQWLTSMRRQSLVSGDGSFDYFEHMDRISIPILLIGGAGDRIAPAASLRIVFDRVGSKDKTMRIFGRRGFELRAGSPLEQKPGTVDYGHDDMLLGNASRSEIFPYIADWMRAHR
jgi:polyhydroxyalkanoate synthase subunit PhaC